MRFLILLPALFLWPRNNSVLLRTYTGCQVKQVGHFSLHSMEHNMNQSQLLFGYHRRWRVRHLSLCVTLPPLVAFWKFVENLEWYRGRYSSNPGISGRQNSFFVALGRNHHLGAAPLALPRRPSIVSCGISRHFWWHALCHNIRIWRCLIIYWTPISILWCAS